jgi:hypothetical protein
MPVPGRKPKPDGQKRNRVKPTFEWAEVPDVPFSGGPNLPAKWEGRPWPTRTKAWWAAVRTMPHCVLWTATDWQHAIDTAHIHAKFADGDVRVAAELGRREKLLGVTLDSRRDLRIRYVDPGAQVDEDEGTVTAIADYRAMLSG